MITGGLIFIVLAAIAGLAQREWDHRHDYSRGLKKKGIV